MRRPEELPQYSYQEGGVEVEVYASGAMARQLSVKSTKLTNWATENPSNQETLKGMVVLNDRTGKVVKDLRNPTNDCPGKRRRSKKAVGYAEHALKDSRCSVNQKKVMIKSLDFYREHGFMSNISTGIIFSICRALQKKAVKIEIK